MPWRAFGETLVTLLVITDPAGNTPIFVGLTAEMSSPERTRAALSAVAAASAVMVLVRRYPGTSGRVAVIAGIAGAAVVLGAVLLLAARLARLVPVPLVNFLTRVFGLLLSAIAVQLIVDGVTTLVRAG